MKCKQCGINTVNESVNGDLCEKCVSDFTWYTTEDMINQKGWICPKCERVYSPLFPQCFSCNHDKPITKKTGD